MEINEGNITWGAKVANNYSEYAQMARRIYEGLNKQQRNITFDISDRRLISNPACLKITIEKLDTE